MTLHLNYRDVARANIEHFDRLGAFHGYGDCLYHYFDFDFDKDGDPCVPTNFCCAIGICDVSKELEEWNEDPVDTLVTNDKLTTDNVAKLLLIQMLHDYKTTGDKTFDEWANMRCIHKGTRYIHIDYINLQSPDDLTPELYKEIMAKIASE